MTTRMDDKGSGRLAATRWRLGFLPLFLFLALAAPAQAADRLGICYAATHAALVPLAKLRGYYAEEGVDVELRRLPSGRQALQAMLAGECALATAAEPPVVHNSLSRNDFLIVASISVTTNLERIVARSDRGILTAADLRGRRIAVPQFTTSHYFLDHYLAANGIVPRDVTQVYLPAQEMAPAFRRGEVDAVAHWEPNIEVLAKEFGSKAKVLTAPGLHVNPMLLVGGRETLRRAPAAVERILRALLRAERYVREQPAEAKALIMRQYELAPSDIDVVWPWHDFRVALGQPLLFILENTARWEIGLLPAAQRPAAPNYLDFIYFEGLTAVKPAVVTIVH